MTDTPTLIDAALGVTVPSRHARGRVARLGPALDAILANHAYPPVLETLLAEALVLTALLGSLLKDPNGQLTLQAQTENGVIDLLVTDYRGGQLRGYIRHDAERLAEAGPNPTLFGLFGKGYLAITFDQPASNERYQGIVPLDGIGLAEAAQSFFAQSEQIPSIVRLAARKDEAGWVAGGLMFQHLPDGEEGRERLHTRLDHPEWPHVATLTGSVTADELVDRTLPLHDLVWRLLHEEEEVRTLAPLALAKGCRCDPAYVASVLARFPAEERAAMVGDDGLIRVDCEFCATSFPVEPEAVG
ncbi:Hsp33 family molecular chaperone HslO [Sphingomonas sp. ASV193]|uniref:Hsp33 family molecular chaperone HslO n=1 Tax=Sphingomonas sp. ASV193 TaxID=3144405 RepID=UPI0032E8E280